MEGVSNAEKRQYEARLRRFNVDWDSGGRGSCRAGIEEWLARRRALPREFLAFSSGRGT